MANLNNFRRRFRVGLASATPFASGLVWCPQCRDETDTDTQAHHAGVTYAWKRSCLRCGSVLAHGVYHNVPLISDVPIPAGTLAWTTAPGIDRR